MFYIDLKKGKHEKIFLFETIRYEASSSGPLPSLFKLSPGAKNCLALGSHVLHGLI